MLSLIELIQRSTETMPTETNCNKEEIKDESLMKLIKNESHHKDKQIKPRKPRQEKSLKTLQQTNDTDNFSLMSSTSSNSSANCVVLGANNNGSISSVSEPSRSSSSIDTASCNTDELLIASNSSPIDSPIGNDLSCSSRRSSICNNDIGLDVELEQIMINNLDYLPKTDLINSTIKKCPESPKNKNKFNNNSNGKKQNRQPSYCGRNRRSRIVRTPLPPQPSFETSDLIDKNDLTNEYKLSSPETTSAQLGLNDYILTNEDDKRTKQSQNPWSGYYDQSKVPTSSQLVNDINKRRKKWNLFDQANGNNTSSSSSGNELNEPLAVIKPKQLHKNINQKIQQLQSQQQQQQTDYPVFKYLSKSLMNTLFTKDNSNSSSCSSGNELNNKSKLTKKQVTSKTEQEQSTVNTKLSTTADNSNIVKKHSTSNYNYLINKYSALSSSASSLNVASALTTTSANQLKTSSTKLNETSKEQEINPIVINIIKDLVSDVIDSLDKKKKNRAILNATPQTTKALFFNNRIFKSEIEAINKQHDLNTKLIESSTFKMNNNNNNKPLIKTLINDISQLNKSINNCTDTTKTTNELEISISKQSVIDNEDDADIDSDTNEDVVNLADNALLININYEMEQPTDTTSNMNENNSIIKLNHNQITSDEIANCDKKITNQISNCNDDEEKEEIIIIKSNHNANDNNFIINKAFVYASNKSNESNYFKANINDDDCCNNKKNIKNLIIKSNDPNDLSNFNNYNNYAKLNNYKEDAKVEVNLQDNNIKEGNNLNIINNITTTTTTNENNTISKVNDNNNLQDILQYPSSESTTTKTKIFLNNLDENKLSQIENSDMTDLIENINKNYTKQTDLTKSGQTNTTTTTVLNDDSKTTTTTAQLKVDETESSNDDDDDDKIPSEPPPPPPPLLLSNDTQFRISELNPIQMMTTKPNCEIEIEKKEDNKEISIKLVDHCCTTEEVKEKEQQNLITRIDDNDDKNCNYSEKILLNNNDLDNLNSAVVEQDNKFIIEKLESPLEISNEKNDSIREVEKEGLINEQTDDNLVTNKSNNNENNLNNNEVGLLLLNKECKNNNNNNNNETNSKNNNEIANKLEFELCSKQENNNNNNIINNNVANNDSMNNLKNNQTKNKETTISKETNEEMSHSTQQTLPEAVQTPATNVTEYLGNNITRIKLKSKEIVLIEDCVDEDEKELDRLIKSKSLNTDLFYNPNASTPATRKKAADLFASKSSTYFSTSLSSDRNNRSSKTDHSNSSNDDDDDPYVKAALERFDAFCRSKSSHSLDKTATAPASPSPAQLITNRNKSPFLTRKTITNPDDDPSFGSFIKRRQAKVDPNASVSTSNLNSSIPPQVPKNAPESSVSLTGSSPDIEKVQAQSPSLNSTKLLNRSCSETRTLDESPRISSAKSMSVNSNPAPAPLSSSSLAKRFLGSLTPQLEPANEITIVNNLDLDEKLYENTITNSEKYVEKLTPIKEPTKETIVAKEPIVVREPIAAKEPIVTTPVSQPKAEVIIVPKRRQSITSTTQAARPSSAGAELSNHQNNSVNNYRRPLPREDKLSKEFNDSEKRTEMSTPSSPLPGTAHRHKNTSNIIKLEVVNNTTKSKLRQEEKAMSPPLDKANSMKPPLPPTGANTIPATPTSTTASNSSPSTTHSTSWRTKLKSIYNEAPIIDGTTKSATSLNEATLVEKQKAPTKSNSRIIPLEVKNTKTGTVTIIKPNSNTNGRSNSISASSSTKKENSTFSVTPPVSASTLQKSGYLTSTNTSPSTTPIDRVRSASSYRPSSANDSQQSSAGSTLRNSSSFTYRDLSPSGRNSTGRALSSSSFHSDSRSRVASTTTDTETILNETDLTNESPDPIAEKACNNFMHKLLEMQRQYKPATSLLPSSQTSSFTEQSPQVPIVSSRVNSLYSDLYKNRSNENVSANPVVPVTAATTSTYPYSSYLYNSTYSAPSANLPAAGVLDSLLSTNNVISSSSSSSLINSENSSSGVNEPPRPYVSAIRKRRTLFSDDSTNSSTDLSSLDNNMASTLSYFQNNNFTSPYQNEYKSPYSTLLSTSSSSILTKTPATPKTPTDSNHNFGRNRPLSIVNEESNNANHQQQTSQHYPTLTRSLSAKDSRSSTNNETNNYDSSSVMISNTPTSQKVKQATQLKKSNSINSSTITTRTEDQQKLRSTVFDRLAALNNTNSQSNSTVMNKSIEVAKSSVPNSNKLTTQKNNSNSCWQLNLSSQQPSQETTNTSRRNSIEKTVGELTHRNITTVLKDQNEIAIVTSVVPTKRNISITINNNNNNKDTSSEHSSASTTSSSSSLSRIRSLDSKSRDKLRSQNKDLKKSNVNLSVSNNQQSLPPSGSMQFKATKSETETSTSRRKSSISNATSTPVNNNCFNSTSNPSFSSNIKTQENCTKKDVFERLSKRTNSMKNLAANLNNHKSTRSTGSPSSSDRENNDGKISPNSVSSDEQVSTNNDTQNSNSISKTSVFERLYKSNIAAHINNQASLLNDSQIVTSQTNVNNLKKNMSLSSANLVSSSLNISTPNTLKKLNQPTSRTPSTQQRTFNKSSTRLNMKDDSARIEANNSEYNYSGDDSNDDSNKNSTQMTAPFILNKTDDQSQQFVF